jgi:hypothetical protein
MICYLAPPGKLFDMTIKIPYFKHVIVDAGVRDLA